MDTIPNPQSPIPNPQSPIPTKLIKINYNIIYYYLKLITISKNEKFFFHENVGGSK